MRGVIIDMELFKPLDYTNSCDGYYADSLDVRFTKACDNNCSFCIERNGIQGSPTNVKRLITNTIESGKQTILILGGEPLLRLSDVLTYVKGIRDNVKYIYLTTSLPNTIMKNDITFRQIMNLINGLNVSLQHYDPVINNNVLQASNQHDRIAIVNHICKDWSRKVRVSINLVKGYIDTKEELDKFLNVMVENHVSHVKINELQNEPDLHISFEKIYDTTLPSAFAFGCQKDIRLTDFPTLRITLKRTCFCVNDRQKASLSDFRKVCARKLHPVKHTQMVIYEDGTLSDGWKTNN